MKDKKVLGVPITIAVGTKAGDEILKALQILHYEVDAGVVSMLQEQDFAISKQQTNVKLVVVSAAELGLSLKEVRSCRKVYQYAEELGLGLCSSEEVVQVALQCQDILKEKGFIIPAMNPMVDLRGHFAIVGLYCSAHKEEQAFYIRSIDGHPDYAGYALAYWIFRKNCGQNLVASKKNEAQLRQEKVLEKRRALQEADRKLHEGIKDEEARIKRELKEIMEICKHPNMAYSFGGGGQCLDCGAYSQY